MRVISTALTATYSSVLSLQGLDTNGPLGFGVSVGETSSDTFVLYGTLDSAAVDNTNAQDLGEFSGGAGNLPAGIANQARSWPFVLVRRTAGSTAGTFFVAGNPAASPAVVSTAAPAGTAYSALMTLTTLGAQSIRIGGSAAMTASDVFDVFLSNDSALASSTGAFKAGRITGGGGTNPISVLVSGYNYAIIQRVSGSTAGNIIAAGVSPSAGGGILNLTTLAVGDTAVNGGIGTPPLTAAESVDVYSAFLLTQTTAGVTAQLRNPTITTASKIALVINNDTSTQSIVMYGENLPIGSAQWFVWDGSAWVSGQNLTQGGNAFGAALQFGTLDNQNVVLFRNSVSVVQAQATSLTLGDVTGAYASTLRGGTGGVTITPTGVGPVTLNGSIIENGSGSVTVPDGTGSIGTAATTVDVASVFYINQATPVITYANMRTIPAPTTTTAGRRIKVFNVGTAVFCIGDATQKQGINLPPGTTPGGAASANKGDGAEFMWNGTAWVPTAWSTPFSAVHAGTANATGNVTRVGRFTQYDITTLGGAIVLTCQLTGALIDDVIRFTRTDVTANTVTINNNAAAALFVMVASKKNFTDVRYNGTDWELFAGGQS